MRLSGRTILAAPLALAVLLAACGPTTSRPVLSPTSAPATRAPSTSAAPPAPTAASGSSYAVAFVAAISAEELTTHVAQDAELRATMDGVQQTVSLALEADIAGPDMAFVITITGGDEPVTQEMRIVGDTAWVLGDGTWASAPRSTVEATLAGLIDNLRIVEDPTQLRYVGPETIDGQALQRLAAIGTVPYAPGTGGSGRYDALDIWVRDDGTPVLVRGSFSATDAAGNTGTGSTELRFSQFGGPITIEAPETP